MADDDKKARARDRMRRLREERRENDEIARIMREIKLLQEERNRLRVAQLQKRGCREESLAGSLFEPLVAEHVAEPFTPRKQGAKHERSPNFPSGNGRGEERQAAGAAGAADVKARDSQRLSAALVARAADVAAQDSAVSAALVALAVGGVRFPQCVGGGMRPGLALRVALRLCGLLTVCVAQVSPSSAQKLADCLTVSELNDLSDSLPLMYDSPIKQEDLLFETEKFSEGDPEP